MESRTGPVSGDAAAADTAGRAATPAVWGRPPAGGSRTFRLLALTGVAVALLGILELASLAVSAAVEAVPVPRALAALGGFVDWLLPIATGYVVGRWSDRRNWGEAAAATIVATIVVGLFQFGVLSAMAEWRQPGAPPDRDVAWALGMILRWATWYVYTPLRFLAMAPQIALVSLLSLGGITVAAYAGARARPTASRLPAARRWRSAGLAALVASLLPLGAAIALNHRAADRPAAVEPEPSPPVEALRSALRLVQRAQEMHFATGNFDYARSVAQLDLDVGDVRVDFPWVSVDGYVARAIDPARPGLECWTFVGTVPRERAPGAVTASTDIACVTR